MCDLKIKFDLIETKDVPAVQRLLKDVFLKDEPINKSLDLDYSKEIADFMAMSMSDKCSFKAVNSNGEIVGAIINGVVQRPVSSEATASYSDACKHEKFKKILTFFEFIDSQFNLFDFYPGVDKYLDAKILTVNEMYRGQGIGGKLIERSIEYIRANNIPIISMMCTSRFSAQLCEKLNFKRVYVLNYADYFVDGENPILPAEPHNAVRIFVKEIK